MEKERLSRSGRRPSDTSGPTDSSSAQRQIKVELVNEPQTVNPVPEPDAEPVPEPDAEPVPEPDAEPVPEPDAEPVPEQQPDSSEGGTAEEVEQ